MDVFVAAAAGDQGHASSPGHQVHPCGFLASAKLVQICELADMVELQVHHVPADLAAPGEEPVDQLVAPGADHDRPLVGEDGRAYSPERDPAEAEGCYGIQPDLALRISVIRVGNTTLLAWARTSKANPDETFFDVSERMLESVRFR